MINNHRAFAGPLLLSLALAGTASTAHSAEPSTLADPLAVVVIRPQVGREVPSAEEPAPTGLLWVGPRYGIGGDSPLGEEQKENFQMYDIAALWRLPWGWRPRYSTWGLETRLISSAGELAAAGKTSFMGTLVPALAVSSRNGGLSLDLGLGFGFFSDYKFGVQNFGGPVQIVGTSGVGFNPFAGFRAGYRFQHFSDAGTYGPTSLGVDMHIIEVGYAF